jgi:Periplasmic binding protein
VGALIGVLDVGIAVPDVGEYAAIDPAWGIGDPREQVLSALDGLRAAGRLPVHGHDLRPSFASYASNDAAGKVEAAKALAAAEPVAILGGRDFSAGARWIAANTPIPVIDVNALPSESLTAAGRTLFTLRTAQDVLYRAAVRWADTNGWLDERRIGVFSDRLTERSAAAAGDELDRLGHVVRAWVRSDGTGVGSDADESAVTTFVDAGVEVVFPFVGGSSWIATVRHADEHGYCPRIVELETGEHTNDVTARRFPSELYDGTLALTMSRGGELAGGFPLGVETERCLDAFERAIGRRLDPGAPAVSGELSNALLTWDLVVLLVEGLRRAGGGVTPTALIDGLERIRGLPIASGGDVSLEAGAHWGIRQVRTIQWHANRGMWVATSPFRPVDGDGR